MSTAVIAVIHLCWMAVHVRDWASKLLNRYAKFIDYSLEMALTLLSNTAKNGDIKILIKILKIILQCVWGWVQGWFFWLIKSKCLLIEIHFPINIADQRSMKLRAFGGPVGIEVTTLCSLLMLLLVWFI